MLRVFKVKLKLQPLLRDGEDFPSQVEMIGIRVLPRHHSKLQGFKNEEPFFFRLYFFRDCLILVPALMAVDEVSSA